ncbi:hypothetical protein TNIN_102321 [Trichonephila inaurata madagascariensis]|uniref:Uncharacterized protein n=1 Tax=Trichonephila inaurata madagascariensis TaxID=2747483 RepID=A0A8X6X581_9ARAC|nr:hypothetical protein TNIN_102321 [Trichonephila inaurata madagascariensis]
MEQFLRKIFKKSKQGILDYTNIANFYSFFWPFLSLSWQEENPGTPPITIMVKAGLTILPTIGPITANILTATTGLITAITGGDE